MTVLIMEDEEEIRDGLEKNISWEQFGVEHIYTAENGQEGLKIARNAQPDLILSDIRMPRMDGISAVRALREGNADCSIIFISAYPEKAYFKEAMKLKAVNFVEKPIDLKELLQVIQEAVEEQKALHKQKAKQKQAFLYESSRLVRSLCRAEFPTEKICRKALEDIGIHTETYRKFKTVLIWHMQKHDEKFWEIFPEILEKNMDQAPCRFLIGEHEETWIFHLFLHRELEAEEFEQWIEQLLSEADSYYIISGTVQGSCMELRDSYCDAVILMDSCFLLPYRQRVNEKYKQLRSTEELEQFQSNLMEQLEKEQYAIYLEQLEQMGKWIREHPGLQYSVLRNTYNVLQQQLEHHMDRKKQFLADMESRKDLIKYGNFEEMHHALATLVRDCTDRKDTESSLVGSIRKYVAQNYQNPWLSIGDIAEKTGRSVSYLCVSFKKETGITLNQYLTNVRMEQAKILLNDPKNSVRDIAELTGYTDSSYFTKAFRKYTGMTPSEYREK